MTPVYMQVIRLKLENMGTAEAKVQLERTNLMPLVNKQAFEALLLKSEDRAYLNPLLFPQESPPSEVPTGMLNLWRLLQSSDEDLGVLFFGRKNQVAEYIGLDHDSVYAIGKLLGSGSQGIVYAVGDNEDIVVKASVVGEVRYIRRELKALEKLGKPKKCKHICELKGMGRVQYIIRDTIAAVPAFVMAPKGVPARDYLSSAGSRQAKVEMLLLLWSNMLVALDFAHEKKVFHLDVSPRNIIYH
jgi:serine/threonine protein kinase